MEQKSRHDTGLMVLIALLMGLALHQYYQGVLERVESAKQVVAPQPEPVQSVAWPALDTLAVTPTRVQEGPHRDIF